MNPTWGEPPSVRTHVEETQQQTVRASMEITKVDLFLQQHSHDMLRHVVDKMGDALAERCTQLLLSGTWDHIINDAIKNAVRDEVKKEVATRVNEFIEEIL